VRTRGEDRYGGYTLELRDLVIRSLGDCLLEKLTETGTSFQKYLFLEMHFQFCFERVDISTDSLSSLTRATFANCDFGDEFSQLGLLVCLLVDE
jgi:hypothetical protein